MVDVYEEYSPFFFWKGKKITENTITKKDIEEIGQYIKLLEEQIKLFEKICGTDGYY